MKIIITFTGNSVQILCGDADRNRIQIQRILPVEFSANCVINGVVAEPEIFLEGMKAAWERYRLPKRGILLSVDGNHIRNKRLSVPSKMPVKKVLDTVSYEFLEGAAGSREDVYSFLTLERGEAENTILALSAERDYIEGFRSLFQKIGIRLEAVTSSRCGIPHVLRYMEEVREQNCVVLSLEGQVLSTILVEQGQYTSLAVSRLFSEHGTASFGAEVGRAVSQLIQLQNTARRAGRVFFIGFTPADFAACEEQVSALGLSSSMVRESKGIAVSGGSLGDCFSHAGILAMHKKEGNLLTVSADEQAKKRDAVLLRILPVLGVVAAFSILSSILVTSNIEKQRQVDSLNSYLQDEANLQAQSDYQGYVEESALLSRKITAAQEMKEAIASYPRAVSALNETIAACGEGIVEVTISSYDAAGGGLSFTASGRNADTLNEFVKALADTGIFYHVTYSGYALAGDSYDVNVSCILSPEAGR